MIIRKSKSLIALLLVVLLSFTFVGCSKSGDSAAASNDKPAAAASGSRPEGVPADYPSKEIEYIYAFGPGSPMEAYFRILADKVKENEGWDHGFVVKFKEGASGKIGWTALANAKPDGYTIGFAPSSMLIPAVAEKAPYGVDNMNYVMNAMSDPGAIGVVADSKYNTLQELIEDAKANPGKVTMGVTSTIGSEGLTVKLIERASGAKFNVVAFDGEGEIFAAVIGKHVDAFCLNVTDALNFLQDKQVKVLATGDEKRSAFLPDVQTYKECGYDVTQVNMRAIGIPVGVPEPIRKYLEDCFMKAANDPEVQAKVKEMNIPVDTLSGTDLKAKFQGITGDLQTLWDAEPWQ